jgi:hypothetical protein
MPNLTPSTGPGGRGAGPDVQTTRVLVVRDDRLARSVRSADQPSRFGAWVGFWTALVVGLVGVTWLTGHLGETLGFAAMLGVSDLSSSDDHGLATGVRILLAVPIRIFEMSLVNPAWLAAAFFLIAAPAGGLAVARPRVPGGPLPSKLALAWSQLGYVAACIVFVGLVAWIAWPDRRATLGEAPLDPARFAAWLDDATITAGFDALALATGVLWLVLLLRLPLPRIAIAFAAAAGLVALVATWTGFATSNGAVDGCRRTRPIIVTLLPPEAGSEDPLGTRSLLLGTLHDRTAVMGGGEGRALMTIGARDFVVVERSSLAAWMTAE